MAIITSRTLPLRDWDKRDSNSAMFCPDWHRSVPKGIARAASWDQGSDGWASWSAYLAARRSPRALATLIASKSPSLSWGMVWAEESTAAGRLPATGALLALLDRTQRGKSWTGEIGPTELATAWTNETAHRQSATFGLECLAWCQALPALAALIEADVWWRLFETLVAAVEEPLAPGEPGILSRQWLATELPLTLAYLFPEIMQARRLARSATVGPFPGQEPQIAKDGMPSAAILPSVRPLLATWARSRLVARQLKKSGWDEAAEANYLAFAGQVLRLSRRNGSLMLQPAGNQAADRELLAAAFVGAPRPQRAALRLAVAGCRGPKDVSSSALPAPAANNEDSALAVLRPSWSRGAERLAVARRGNHVFTELACGRDVLWSGQWTCEVRRNGELLAPEADAEWDEVCWSSTEDADYLELELALGNGIRVQRQLLLAREDRFLFLADAVLGEEPAALDYRSVLPLAEEIAFDASTETREGYLVGRKARGLLYPLALPEWRAEPAPGGLDAVETGLELRASRGSACRLYAPLFIDLDPRRLFQPATWRQLTIAEWRQVVPADVAVGYRVQVRNKQWLIYRSLGKRGNRTLLGQNLVSEFLVARFATSGEIAPLLEIE